VCDQPINQNINAENKEQIYFGDKVETLYIKDKNYSGVAKPRKSTIKKKTLITKQSYSHTPNAIIVP
jgi:hypothetical protein